MDPVPTASSGLRSGAAASRRRDILAAAIQLFYERGYRDTGIDDIGRAVGMSGPSIYHHFKSKQEILEKSLIEFGRQEMGRVQTILDTDSPAQALQHLIDQEIDAFLEFPAISAVGMRERRFLGSGMQALVELAERQHRQMLVQILMRERPELSAAEAETIIRCCQRMILALTDFHPDLERPELSALLKRMARRVLAS